MCGPEIFSATPEPGPLEENFAVDDTLGAY